MWNIIGNSFTQGIACPKDFTINEFNDRTLNAFERTLCQASDLGQPIFPIKIGSFGGDADLLMGFMSLMEEFRKPEKGAMIFPTIVSSRAMSAGAVIAMYGDVGMRFIGSYANLMMHGLQVGVGGRLSETKNYIDWIHLSQAGLLKKLSKHLKKRPEWLEKELNKRQNEDWFLNAEQSVEVGFSDSIQMPVFQMKLIPEFGYY